MDRPDRRADRRPTGGRTGVVAALIVAFVSLALVARLPAQDELPPLPDGAQDIHALPADPVARETALSRGIVDFEGGRFAEALGRFDEAGPPGTIGAGGSYFRGLSLLALERAREALGEFERVSDDPDAPREVQLDLGVAQLEIGDAESAAGALADYVADRPDDPYGHYFLGVARFRLKEYQEAFTQFQLASDDAALAPYLDFYRSLAASTEAADSPLAAAAAAGEGEGNAAAQFARQLNGLPGGQNNPPAGAPGARAGYGRPNDPGADADRRWNFAVITGYEYDTNVSLAPAITPLGLGGTGARDSRWLVSSFGDYRLIQKEKLVLGLIGSTYDSFQFRLDQYNVQDYMLGTYSNVSLGPFIAGIRYQFHETLLNGNQFTTDHRLTPNLTLREGSVGHLTGYYELESVDVTGFAIVPAQVRSGNINSVGATQAFYLFNGAGRLYFGYRFDKANTVGSDFDRKTNQADVRLEIPLPWEMVGNIEARYFWDDYLNPNSLDFFNRPRRDRRIEARAGVQKFFTPHISARLEYVYTNNNSNVENLFGTSFYTYDRHLLSALLIYDF